MPHHHRRRVEDQLRRVLSEALRSRIKDPRLALVSVTGVTLTPDLRYARAYLSIVGSEDEVAETLRIVQGAAGVLRSEVGRAMRMRHTPEIRYFHDESVTAQARIERLLEQADQDRVVGDGSDAGDGDGGR